MPHPDMGTLGQQGGQEGPFPVCQLVLCMEEGQVRTSCMGAGLRAVLKAPQSNDPKSITRVALEGQAGMASVTWAGNCPSEGGSAPPWSQCSQPRLSESWVHLCVQVVPAVFPGLVKKNHLSEGLDEFP